MVDCDIKGVRCGKYMIGFVLFMLSFNWNIIKAWIFVGILELIIATNENEGQHAWKKRWKSKQEEKKLTQII